MTAIRALCSAGQWSWTAVFIGCVMVAGGLNRPLAVAMADESGVAVGPVRAPRPPAVRRPVQKRLTVEQLTAQARRSVVVITVSGRDGRRQGLGTGFIVSPDGLIATNRHVIGDARPIRVRLADGRKFPVTAVHATDRLMDLAIVRIDAHHLPALRLGSSRGLKQGQPVVALGNPLGLKYSVVSGVVSGRRVLDGKPLIQLAIPIEPGNSGGPLLDRRGRVEGIITLKSQVTPNLGFAVEIDALKPLLKKPNPVPMARWLTIGTLDSRVWTTLFGAHWRQRAGRILVEGRGSGFGGRALCLAKTPPPELPFEIAVTVRLGSEDGAAGLVFYSDGHQKHYGFYPSNGRLRLSRFDGPDVYSWRVLREVRSRAYRPGEWNTLKVRLESGRIQCFVNDQPVIESRLAVSGRARVGLAKFRDTRAEFKRFRVARKIPPTRPSSSVADRVMKIAANIAPSRPPTQRLIERLVPDSPASSVVLRERARLLEQRAERLRQLASEVGQTRTRRELARLFKTKPGTKQRHRIDLLRAALLVARIDNEDVDVEVYLRIADRMAGEIRTLAGTNAGPDDKLSALNRYLFRELGFHGSRFDYYNRSNSYLNEVIDDREGLPITLSILYMDLARRIGLTIVGVGLPGHFVVRYEPKQGAARLIDVFDGGKTLSRRQADERVRTSTGHGLTDEQLGTQTEKQIILRMLRNLLGVAREAADSEAMLRYVETMVVLEPDAPRDRWFRAILRFQTGRIKESLADTDWILEREPAELDLARVRQLHRVLENAGR